ncbi:hypothetical protein [Flexivirga sp. B27]
MPGEAADSYAERVAAANNLAAATLPSDPSLRSVGRVRHAAARNTPVQATSPRRQGWDPGAITQACAACLATDGAWRHAWYDPMVTVCLTHGCYLITDCPGRRRSVKDTQHRPLRPAGTGTLCDNALSVGLGPRCDTDLAQLPPTPAPDEVLEQQARAQQSGTGPVMVLGQPTTVASYRDTVRNMAVLLLHINTASPDPPARFDLREQEWGTRRWWLHPPRDPITRAAVFAVADRIVFAASLDDAAAVFMPWFDAIPPASAGRVSWAADHTHADPTLTRILLAASTPRQRLSHRLPHELCLRLRPEWIPQRLPAQLSPLVDGCGLSAASARGFASLCLAKAQAGTGSWADAATLLELPGPIGVDLARTSSAHLTIGTDAWIDRLQQVGRQLAIERVDYRARESVVRGLGRAALNDLLHALQAARPGTRASSRDLIWRWVWDHWAAGHHAAAPPVVITTRRFLARYTQFAGALQPHHERALVTATDQITRGTPDSS